MKILTRALAFLAVVLWVFAAVPLAAGQGRGGGGGGSASMKQAGSHQTQRAGQRGSGATARDRQLQRIQLPDQQRDRYHDCASAADQIRRQARDLSKMAKGSGFNAADARQRRDQLHEHFATMVQQHERFMDNFGANAQAMLQDRTRQLEQDRTRLEKHLQAMDRELGRDDPDRTRVRSEAREVKRAMTAWQRHYRQLGDDVGVG